MDISIIIPVFNREKYIQECINSCFTQNIPTENYEIIIIEDGSTDHSLDVIKLTIEGHDNVILFTQENKGLSVSRNRGIKNAKGNYILFLDSDDWLAQNCLNLIIEKTHAENPDVLCICAADVINGENFRRQHLLYPKPLKGKDVLCKGIPVCAPFGIWKRDFLNNNNLEFVEGIYHEDEEFSPRAYYLADKVSFIDDIIYFVRQTPDSITRTANPKKSFDLIEVVCPSLYLSYLNADEEYKQYFIEKISMLIYSSLRNIIKTKKEDQDRFNNTLNSNTNLFSLMLLSHKLWLRVLGRLLLRFPKKRINLFVCYYRIINILMMITHG